MSAVAASTNPLSRVWAAYLRQLETKPLRTKMATASGMFLLGDCIAQFGIEGRKIGGEGEGRWDPIRAARLSFYGGTIFAPLAHTWLGLVDRVRYPSKARTLITRLALDQGLWGPSIVFVFWSANGFLEGKSFTEVKQKVEHAFIPSVSKGFMVFAPTQLINFTLIPLQHRLAVLQTVGLGWNIYLSYINNINNRKLAAAAQAVALAEGEADPSKLIEAEKVLLAAQAKQEAIKAEEGGGATGVGTRMGW